MDLFVPIKIDQRPDELPHQCGFNDEFLQSGLPLQFNRFRAQFLLAPRFPGGWVLMQKCNLRQSVQLIKRITNRNNILPTRPLAVELQKARLHRLDLPGHGQHLRDLLPSGVELRHDDLLPGGAAERAAGVDDLHLVEVGEEPGHEMGDAMLDPAAALVVGGCVGDEDDLRDLQGGVQQLLHLLREQLQSPLCIRTEPGGSFRNLVNIREYPGRGENGVIKIVDYQRLVSLHPLPRGGREALPPGGRDAQHSAGLPGDFQ
mmetsp:Transcript_15602/g.37518  ORF Transcript_15602/g.37518 Transcript_15602/m.37518 type:complete len:260 (-) Transcript_15602:78-857(-)